jgi:competence protein ComEC
LLLVLALVAGFAQCGLRAGLRAQHGLDAALEGRSLRVTGRIATMPQRQAGGLRFVLDVESAQVPGQEGQPVRLPPHLWLGWYRDAHGPEAGDDVLPALQTGERWQLTLRLQAPHGNLNPYGFDYELWLWEQGWQATGYVRTGAQDLPALRLTQTYRYPLELARQTVRDAIVARLNLPAEVGDTDDAPAASAASAARARNAGIVAALVTGDQAAISRADWDIFRATGVAHLMSISGLHITLFAWVAAAFMRAVWRRTALWGWHWCLWWPAPTAALVGGTALAWAYALFSGWGLPAQRTILMLVTVAVLRHSARRWPWSAVWLLACGVVVAFDPWALLQAGFWLSFVAVGVLFATDGGQPAADADTGPTTPAWARVLRALRHLLREQGVVTLALTPLSLLLFGQVSVVGLLANVLAIPWVTLVVTPLALGGMLLPPLWDAAAWAVQPLAVVLTWLAAWPGATVSLPAAPVWAAALGVLGGALLVMRLPWGLRALGVPLLLPVLLWQVPRPASGEFELLAADVGQGNAVIVRTARHTLVYDAGPRFSADSDAGQRVLVPLLRALGERVDTLMLSHRDSDHTGGAPAVLLTQPQAVLLSSIESSHPLQALRPAQRCQAGQHWDWDGVHFAVLHPQADDYAHPNVRPNALSCVLRISSQDGGWAAPDAAHPSHSALLVGDIEAAQEAQLLYSSPVALRADVLLVPHHGSKTSSTPAFVAAVQPRYALIQAGYRNRYGHPTQAVLARYREHGVDVVETPRCGAARWRSAQPAQVDCVRRQVAHYWHHAIP